MLDRLALFAAVVCFTALIAYAAPASSPRVLVVNALDLKGVPADGLTEKNFRATYRKQIVAVAAARRYTIAPRTVILLDIGASMGSSSKFGIAKEEIRALLSAANTSEQFALLTFATGIVDRIDFSPGGIAILRWLDSATTRKAPAAMSDAIARGVKQLEPVEYGDSIFMLTDADNKAGQVHETEVRAMLANSGVRLFAFLFQSNNFVSEENLESHNEIASFVRTSCVYASYLSPNTLDAWGYTLDESVNFQVKSSAELMEKQISNFYVLNVDLPETAIKPKDWALEAVDDTGKRRKDLTLSYPRDLGTFTAAH